MSALTVLCLCSWQLTCCCCIVVDGCERDENNLASVTELLIDALMDSQDDSTRKSIWRSIVESGQVRFTIWKQVRLMRYKYKIKSSVYWHVLIMLSVVHFMISCHKILFACWYLDRNKAKIQQTTVTIESHNNLQYMNEKWNKLN